MRWGSAQERRRQTGISTSPTSPILEMQQACVEKDLPKVTAMPNWAGNESP